MHIIKNVIFDLYGTLLDIHTDEDQNELWDKLAHFYKIYGGTYTSESIKKAYIEEVKKRQHHEECDIDILEVFDTLFKNSGVVVSQQTLVEVARLFRIVSLEYVKPYPHAEALLNYLKKHGYRIILLSNAQRSFTMDELTATGIKDKFDGIYLSSDYKWSKPATAFYTAMLLEELILVNECIFIGNDHRTDIEGANRLGMKSIYLHTNCSPVEVPDEIDCTYRIDSGDILEIIRIFELEIQRQ